MAGSKDATLGYGRTEADRRLAIFAERRADDLHRATLALIFRRLRVGPFPPILRVTAERNSSRIEIFDYRRVRTEIGIARSY